MGENQILERVAYVDELTGLRNRNGLFLDFGNKNLDNQHFIYVDIDDFKKMNSVFGIDAVDRMLIIISNTLKDYCGKSSVYRVGAGQFVLVTDSHIICEPSELQRLLKQPVVLDDLQILVNASICVLDHDDFPKTSLKRVIKLMQLTLDVEKRKGRNILVFASNKTMDMYREKRDIALSLFSGVKRKEFFPKFIPFVDTYTNEIIGYETVSRWNLNGKILTANCFLEAAEWTGLVYDIELQMFEEAAKFFKELRETDDLRKNKSLDVQKRFKAGVHFSAYTLKRIDVDELLSILAKYDIPQSDMIIQSKEEYIVDQEAYKKIIELHSRGFLVCLDDYSNSAASLSYLADLNVDIIKLSEDLLTNIDKTQEYTKMMHVYKFIVDITKQFNITVVSDGINSGPNAKLVRDLDVHIGLGEFYSKAITKREFLEFAKNNKKKRYK